MQQENVEAKTTDGALAEVNAGVCES